MWEKMIISDESYPTSCLVQIRPTRMWGSFL